MTDLVVHPPRAPLKGVLQGPPGPGTCDLALTLAAVSTPGSRIEIELRDAPRPRSLAPLRALGVEASLEGSTVCITAVGPHGLRPPSDPLELPPSPTAFGFFLGLLAGQGFACRIDASGGLEDQLHDAARTLRQRSAQLEGLLDPARPGWLGFPLELEAAANPLAALELDLLPDVPPVVKAAALGSALVACDETFIRETALRDDRLERMLAAAGCAVESAGPVLRCAPSTPAWPGGPLPADTACSVALLTAALAVPDSLVGVRGVAANPTATGWLEALREAGATVSSRPAPQRLGQAVLDVDVAAGAPGPLRFGGERAARAAVPLPLLVALAAFGSGTSELLDLPFEPRRAEATLTLCADAGLPHHLRERGLRVEAVDRLAAPRLSTGGDPMVAMAATLLALRAPEPCRVFDAGAIVTRFPRFVACLRALGVHIEVLPS